MSVWLLTNKVVAVVKVVSEQGIDIAEEGCFLHSVCPIKTGV
jgi:hypothetical protein